MKDELDKSLREEYNVTILAFLDGVSNAFECKCLFTIASEWDLNKSNIGWVELY